MPLGVHLGHPKSLLGHGLVAHMSRLLCALEGAGCVRRAARLGLAVDHRAVGHVGAVEVIPLDNAREALALARARHAYLLTDFKEVRPELVANRDRCAVLDLDFTQEPLRLHTRLSQMALLRPRQPSYFDIVVG